MKVFATVRIENEKTAGFLVRAFFRAYKPENILYLRGKEAELQMELDGTEQEDINFLAESISHCEVIKLQHGDISLLKTLESSGNGNTDNSEDESATKKHTRENSMVNFEGIAANSSSYEEFKSNVLEKLQMSNSLKEIFSHLLEIAEEVDEVKWRTVVQIYEKRYDQSLKSQRSNLQAKLRNITGLSVMECLAVIVSHKKCFYETQKVSEGDSSDKPEDSENQGKTSTDCIRLGEYNGVEMLAGIIDKTQSLAERVGTVLSEMQLPTDQFQKDSIQKMVEKLITQPVIDLSQEDMEIRMNFANMVNVFMKKHGRKTYIKAKEFLQELQPMILTDEEKEQYKIEG